MLLSPTKIIGHLLIPFDVVVYLNQQMLLLFIVLVVYSFISNYLVTMLLTDVIVTVL